MTTLGDSPGILPREVYVRGMPLSCSVMTEGVCLRVLPVTTNFVQEDT